MTLEEHPTVKALRAAKTPQPRSPRSSLRATLLSKPDWRNALAATSVWQLTATAWNSAALIVRLQAKNGIGACILKVFNLLELSNYFGLSAVALIRSSSSVFALFVFSSVEISKPAMGAGR